MERARTDIKKMKQTKLAQSGIKIIENIRIYLVCFFYMFVPDVCAVCVYVSFLTVAKDTPAPFPLACPKDTMDLVSTSRCCVWQVSMKGAICASLPCGGQALEGSGG